MQDVNSPNGTLEEPGKRRTAAARFAHLGDRLRTLPTVVRGEPAAPAAELEAPAAAGDSSWYDVIPRFPIVRSGYECAAVDEHITELERELAALEQEFDELRVRTPARDEVAAEICRIGEETSAILLAAHERAQQTTREAQAQADRCLADAAANALAITEQANRERREIEVHTRRLGDERARLLEDMEALAGTLSAVAKDASSRFGCAPAPAALPGAPRTAPPRALVDQPTAAFPGPAADAPSPPDDGI